MILSYYMKKKTKLDKLGQYYYCQHLWAYGVATDVRGILPKN